MKITAEMTKLAWRAYDEARRGPVDRIEAVFAAIAPLIIEECARIAQDACLVPPDGGSPTEAECAVADEAARRIRSLMESPYDPFR